MTVARGTIVVTGANGGLGSSIVDQIIHQSSIAKDYYGLYTVRKVESAHAAKRVIRSAASIQHNYDLIPLDLSSLDSVRKAAESINKRVASGDVPPIRALVLNAGYQEHGAQNFTRDGFDMTFQSTYLSHFLFTLLLLQSMDKEKGRIVVLGSWTHDTTDPRNKLPPFDNMYVPEEFQQIFKDPKNTESIAKGTWGAPKDLPDDPCAGIRRYGASKLSEIMMMNELSYRLPKDPELSGISVLSVDPAAMPSSLTRRGNWTLRVLIPIVLNAIAPVLTWWAPNGDLRTTWKSAGDVIRACFDTKDLGQHPNGLYLNGSAISDVGPEAKDREKSGQLWRDSIGYAGVEEGDTILVDWH
ncbi:NAD(P)-binding protein [Xylariaceae sp. FL0662B]|nr:NAD(P)-binding protein [Xylariaceae sp. FL0662B]